MTSALGLALGMPPRDALAHFRGKDQTLTGPWYEMLGEAHAKSFTVAHLACADILNDIHAGLDKAKADGLPFEKFRAELQPLLQAKGWWGQAVDPVTGEVYETYPNSNRPVEYGTPRRLRTIYQTNLQQAYNAGQGKFMLENVEDRPLWQYVAVMDSRTRPSHAQLNGLTFRYDDPFWSTFDPANGFNCRCGKRALSASRARSEGVVVQTSGESLSQREVPISATNPAAGMTTVAELKLPGWRDAVRTDPGFNYSPTFAAWGSDVALMRKLRLVRDDTLYSQAVQLLNNAPSRQQAYATWAERFLGNPHPRRAGHEAHTVGLVTPEVAAFAREHGTETSGVLVVTQKALAHADSPKHEALGVNLEREEYLRLPDVVAKPDAVYWDNAHQNLVYVRYISSDHVLMLSFDTQEKVKKISGAVDALANALKYPVSILKDLKRFVRMQ